MTSIVDPDDYDLDGLVDMHVHTAPDVRPRFGDDVEVARTAAEAAMKGILIKSHVVLTADRATIAEKIVPGIRVFGGIALNYPVGGLNSSAVEVALKLGARQIWMPTIDAAAYRRWEGATGGISILSVDGEVLPVVHEIIEMARSAGVILGTGHLSIPETCALVRLGRETGLRKIVVTHPEARFIRMPLETQAELLAEGVYFERCYGDTMARSGPGTSIAEIADRIRRVGAESTVLSTDFGQADNPSPVEGMRRYLAELSSFGLSQGELRQMAGDNPASLLGM